MNRSDKDSGAPDEDAGQFGQHHKLGFIKYFMMLAVAGASLAAFFHFSQGYFALGTVEMLAAAISLMTVYFFRRRSIPTIVTRLAVSTVYIMFAVGSFTQMDTMISVVWIPAYPIIYFFLTQSRKGLYLSILSLITLISAYLLHPYLHTTTRIPTVAFIQIISAMVFVGALSFFYEIVRSRQEQMLKSHADIDYLTGIYNRRGLNQALSVEINRVERYGNQLSFVLLDLDNFKLINDKHGHKLGDKLLRDFCQLTRGVLRESDIFARWGGEEFAILLPEAKLEKARLFADKLRATIAAHEFETVGRITVSMGVAEYKLPESQDALLHRADTALYRAKETGKNRVLVEDHALSTKDKGTTPKQAVN